jgi:hypothetical protein
VSEQASAVAMVNPRDICFVVDLSSSMNFDTLPDSDSASTSLIQKVYDDLFGAGHVTYPDSSTYSIAYQNTATAMSTLSSKMPYVIPAPDTSSSASKAYWGAYFSYVNNGSISYKSYVKFLFDKGRDQLVVSGTASQYSVISVMNPSFHSHSEVTDGGTFNFPTPEMPTHAVRRAVIAALAIIRDRNSTVSESSQKDWVSLVVFDKQNEGGDNSHVRIAKSLTDNYSDVMNACTTLQATGVSGYCTDSEGGLIVARNHIKAASQGGSGRENANKVVVFLTDGNANLYESSTTTIDNYKRDHPGGWGTSYAQNGALMQAQTMQGNNWSMYAVGVGLGGSQSFMNLMANKGGTAVGGAAYPIADDASAYETNLKAIFNRIITNPKLRLVQ